MDRKMTLNEDLMEKCYEIVNLIELFKAISIGMFCDKFNISLVPDMKDLVL